MPKFLAGSMDWGSWLYGLFAGAIGGGSAAVTGGFAAMAVDSKDFGMGTANSFKLMGMMFVFSAVKDAMLYLKQNPLPPIVTQTVTESVSHTTTTVIAAEEVK